MNDVNTKVLSRNMTKHKATGRIIEKTPVTTDHILQDFSDMKLPK